MRVISGNGQGARQTRPDRPQTNGKVERWFQTLLRECLYLRPLASEDERRLALDAFVEYFNNERPHLGIKGLTPLAALSTTLGETTASPNHAPHRRTARLRLTTHRDVPSISQRNPGRSPAGVPHWRRLGCAQAGRRPPRTPPR
ncbi:MAG: transposase [Actinobacteria bacterium]|nr:transposase [Actinomycetota bacterium]